VVVLVLRPFHARDADWASPEKEDTTKMMHRLRQEVAILKQERDILKN
jgi:hypothetical protein